MTEINADRHLVTTVAAISDEIDAEGDVCYATAWQRSLLGECAKRLGDSWTAFARDVASAMASPPYAVIIRGHGVESATGLLMAASACLGDVINPFLRLMPDAPYIHEITPKGPKTPDLVWLWHTDSAHWPCPNDYSALACVRTASESGGATEVLSLETALGRSGLDMTTLEPLWESYIEWPVARLLGGGTHKDKSITADRLRFRRELMQGHGSGRFQAAVEAFCSLVDSCEPDVAALLHPGDLLLFDNRKVLHRAGPLSDPRRERLLLRTMISAATPAAAMGAA